MSSPEDNPSSLVPVAPGAQADLPTPNSAEADDLAACDLPSLQHAEIAIARRYSDASRAAGCSPCLTK